MTDRTIAYTNELLRSQDFLQAQKDTLYAVAYLSQMVLGVPGPTDIIPGNAWLDGFVCAPTSPASLQVTIGSGSLYEMEVVDAAPYGVLSTDSHTVLKQGILADPVTINITPPATAGYAQYYLIQAIYDDVDGGSTVLPYFNSLNPLQPFAGPANSGTAQYTIRQGLTSIALKPGVAAPSGSQTIPTPDAGYTALYTILVLNGQTQVISNNISVYQYFPDTPAPFVTTKLPLVPPAIQEQKDNYDPDTGTANTMAVTLPQWTNIKAGLTLRIKKNVSNTGTVVLGVNGGTNYTVQWGDGSPLIAGDWPANDIGVVIFDGSLWQLVSMPGPTVFARISGPLSGLVHYGVDSGTANAMSVPTVTPSISSVQLGMQFEILKSAASNTSGVSATICGTSSPVFWADGSILIGSDWPANSIGVLIYDGVYYKLQSVMGPTVYQRVLPQTAIMHYSATTGTNSLSGNTNPGFVSLIDGTLAHITPGGANTGATTLSLNGIPAAALLTPMGGAMPTGIIQANQPFIAMALSGVWRMIAGYYPSIGSNTITNIQVITTTGNYVPTGGAQKALAFITGGGGGGGVAYGGGGGAGATSIVLISISGNVACTIGAGGAGNTAPYAGFANGGNGGTTSFGAFGSANGGGGANAAQAGIGGSSGTGTMIIQGGDGIPGYSQNGNGGGSFWGSGGAGTFPGVTPASPGRAYGSGGGASNDSDTSSAMRTSGAGAQGVIFIMEF